MILGINATFCAEVRSLTLAEPAKFFPAKNLACPRQLTPTAVGDQAQLPAGFSKCQPAFMVSKISNSIF